MLKAILTFIISSLISYVVLIIVLLIWTSTIKIDDPSDADGTGFTVVHGVVWGAPLALVIGFFISIFIGVIHLLDKDPGSFKSQPEDK